MAKSVLQGTLSNTFQIGKRGLLIRFLSGVLGVRNATNTAFAEIQAADPTTDDALVTRRYHNANPSGTNKGTAILNFGAFPGTSDASVTITGQTAIVAGSIVNAWLRPAATSDHTADEHMIETLKVFAGNIVAGTGFTIYGFNTGQLNERLVLDFQRPSNGDGDGTYRNLNFGGIGTRIYGQWTIQWQWA